MSKDFSSLSPMMKQYWEVKNRHKDYLLFYRMGDFYELFYEDAIIASKDLEIALTKRGQHNSQDIAMCGVPVHTYEVYLAKLIQKGHRVAVCEQLESPKTAKKRGSKGPLERDVVRIVTPGTVTEDSLLSSKHHNYLVCISGMQNNSVGCAVVDVSTGDFFTEKIEFDSILSMLSKLSPAEILCTDSFAQMPEILNTWKQQLTPLPSSRYDYENAHQRLKDWYEISSLDSLGSFDKQEIIAAGTLLDYLYLTQKESLPNLKQLRSIVSSHYLMLDYATRKSLELTLNQKGEEAHSLLHCIDYTRTACGGRLLVKDLNEPLLDLNAINTRLDQVEYFFRNHEKNHSIFPILDKFPDIERSLTRVMMNKANPRDLGQIRQGIEVAQELQNVLGLECPECLREICKNLEGHQNLLSVLKNSLLENLPIHYKEGGFIRKNCNKDLDYFFTLRDEGHDFIQDLQKKYIEDTGITSLKIRHNFIMGYHIEVTPSFASKVPSYFIHRQTLASCLRYTTPDLIELANNITHASQKSIEIELQIFNDLVQKVKNSYLELQKLAGAISIIDVRSSLGYLAYTRNYCRPEVVDDTRFDIKNGRHPVVEKVLPNSDDFINNHCNLDENSYFILLTGPNMAGKSTYLRQNALITIMAQMGSYVPASRAIIGIVDRIFSRIGTADDLAGGRSTFMVEMIETATILNQSTKKSLVILDEIGRGTSTYDGLSIAWSVVEYLHNVVQCRSIFATHYHELTQLNNELKYLCCKTMHIEESNNQVFFMHQVKEGSTHKSYGIHVASLAGIPRSVIKRANDILNDLESQKSKPHQKVIDFPKSKEYLTSIYVNENKVIKKLEEMDLNNISPLEALNALFNLKREILNKTG